MSIRNLINVDPHILGGQPTFAGTDIPIKSLFDHLEAGKGLGQFTEEFPSVSKAHAAEILQVACKMMTSKNLVQLLEAVV